MVRCCCIAAITPSTPSTAPHVCWPPEVWETEFAPACGREKLGLGRSRYEGLGRFRISVCGLAAGLGAFGGRPGPPRRLDAVDTRLGRLAGVTGGGTKSETTISSASNAKGEVFCRPGVRGGSGSSVVRIGRTAWATSCRDATDVSWASGLFAEA